MQCPSLSTTWSTTAWPHTCSGGRPAITGVLRIGQCVNVTDAWTPRSVSYDRTVRVCQTTDDARTISRSHTYDASRNNQHSFAATATAYRFTGKERDTESGNDYFDARYYSSAMGRFLSPDWSAKEDPVPYAKLDDPQSLNLYAYVENNPLTRVDADGHDGDGCCDITISPEEPGLPPLPNPFHPLVPYPDEYTLTPDKLQQGLSDLGDAISSFFQRIYGAGRRFYPDDAKKIADDANHTCQYCGTPTVPAQKSTKGVTPPANEGQTDHEKAKSKGGTNHPSNGKHACRACNRAKSDKNVPPAPAPPPPPPAPPPPTPPPNGE